MTLLCLADGNSIITEKIFPDRFLHVAELSRMGAHLRKEGPTVMVPRCQAPDRGTGDGVGPAGVGGTRPGRPGARGATRVHRVYHLERGYERLEDKLRAVGADIQRKEGEEL